MSIDKIAQSPAARQWLTQVGKAIAVQLVAKFASDPKTYGGVWNRLGQLIPTLDGVSNDEERISAMTGLLGQGPEGVDIVVEALQNAAQVNNLVKSGKSPLKVLAGLYLAQLKASPFAVPGERELLDRAIAALFRDAVARTEDKLAKSTIYQIRRLGDALGEGDITGLANLVDMIRTADTKLIRQVGDKYQRISDLRRAES